MTKQKWQSKIFTEMVAGSCIVMSLVCSEKARVYPDLNRKLRNVERYIIEARLVYPRG